MIPLGIVEEAGRLPLKRGPRALQEKGVPYYHLTSRGLLVALALDEIIGREKILERFFAQYKDIDDEFVEQIEILAKFASRFVFSLFKSYVKAYCDGKLEDLLPFDKRRFLQVSDEFILTQKEFLESFIEMSKLEKEKTLGFLKSVG
ncbi:MAG: hypothetical protein QXW37_04385 [Candidatus Nitrosotenuis sp.]